MHNAVYFGFSVPSCCSQLVHVQVGFANSMLFGDMSVIFCVVNLNQQRYGIPFASQAYLGFENGCLLLPELAK